ncbi:MAG: nucleotidyltransferase family protein [Bacteroidales bacterium]|nr:nucleotidyltransferase family protein [Bacteroidales bacterium]
MRQDVNTSAFFALLRAGLWQKEVRILPFEGMDFAKVYKIADQQSVVGIVAAGLEYITDTKPVKREIIPFISRTLKTEERNTEMNRFLCSLLRKLRNADVYTLLVKGQGIAQCYERPLWRACGDVDLLLDAENFEKAKAFLLPYATNVKLENAAFECFLGPWKLELHRNLHSRLSSRMDNLIDEIQNDTIAGGNVRVWQNGETDVYLPGVDNDIVFIFTHFLKHFYKGGLGLRQICDWCRLLWTYREKIDVELLAKRLREMRLMSEWKAFAAYAVDFLGMPADAMPLYDASSCWSRKARRIHRFILKVGNFGHNRDMSYFEKYPFIIRKIISLGQRLGDLCRHALIFPLDSMRFLPSILFNGLKAAARGE